ncbi:hypothetical protein [Methylomonas koyamae]|uniref:hypothetical protein n=1 Tax=Methylomonas koyamae TaxID=702114 RepID=UPI00278C6AAE|nr:hypothetical protein [Methylomonas koyamae]
MPDSEIAASRPGNTSSNAPAGACSGVSTPCTQPSFWQCNNISKALCSSSISIRLCNCGNANAGVCACCNKRSKNRRGLSESGKATA